MLCGRSQSALTSRKISLTIKSKINVTIYGYCLTHLSRAIFWQMMARQGQAHTAVRLSPSRNLHIPSLMWFEQDYGTLTLLFQDSVGGLEVQNPHSGAFVPANPIVCIITHSFIFYKLLLTLKLARYNYCQRWRFTCTLEQRCPAIDTPPCGCTVCWKCQHKRRLDTCSPINCFLLQSEF